MVSDLLIRSLALAVAETPSDPAPRMALTDHLIERENVRAELVQVVPRLLAVPKRPLRPTIDDKVIRGGRDGFPIRTRTGDWPRLPVRCPKPDEWGWKWPGFAGRLGRLLGIAIIRDLLGPPPVVASLLTAWEMVACDLLTWDEADRPLLRKAKGCGKYPLVWRRWRLCEWLKERVAADWVGNHYSMGEDILKAVRNGGFNKFAMVGEMAEVVVGMRARQGGPPYPECVQVSVTASAQARSRVLDLRENFMSFAPWGAAERVWKERGAAQAAHVCAKKPHSDSRE
jgi:hypothetical protein